MRSNWAIGDVVALIAAIVILGAALVAGVEVITDVEAAAKRTSALPAARMGWRIE